MAELSMIVDTLTLLALIVLYFVYDRHAVARPRRRDVGRTPRAQAPSRGRVVPFRPRRVA
jgi:hypothetical protein